jgi:hypothetical protein
MFSPIAHLLMGNNLERLQQQTQKFALKILTCLWWHCLPSLAPLPKESKKDSMLSLSLIVTRCGTSIKQVKFETFVFFLHPPALLSLIHPTLTLSCVVFSKHFHLNLTIRIKLQPYPKTSFSLVLLLSYPFRPFGQP